MLGARIAMLRRQQGMSQKELGARLGVSPSTIGMYEQERREPDCVTLVSLAEIFGVSTDFLLTGNVRAAEDLHALGAVWQSAKESLDGTLMLRGADGTERPFGEAELALLLAALVGGTD